MVTTNKPLEIALSHKQNVNAAIKATREGQPIIIFNHLPTLDILQVLSSSLGTTHQNSVFPEVR
jgi:hypothetical protein